MSREQIYFRLLEGRVPDGALARLTQYAVRLEKWAAKHSLIRFSTAQELVERHLLEALEAIPLLGDSGRLLDIGSGAGLPGIPLLCALPQWSGVLLEPRSKKWAFLKMTLRELKLDGEAVREAFEDHVEVGYQAVMSRALGGQIKIAEWSRDHLATGGSVLFWATAKEEGLLRGLSGWDVLGFPTVGLSRGRLIQMKRGARFSGDDGKRAEF